MFSQPLFNRNYIQEFCSFWQSVPKIRHSRSSAHTFGFGGMFPFGRSFLYYRWQCASAGDFPPNQNRRHELTVLCSSVPIISSSNLVHKINKKTQAESDLFPFWVSISLSSKIHRVVTPSQFLCRQSSKCLTEKVSFLPIFCEAF